MQIRVLLQEISTHDFQALKLVAWRGNVNIIAVVHVHDRGCRDNRVHLPGLTTECGPRKHAQPHEPGILNFHANFGCSDGRIENGADVANPPAERPVGIGIEHDLRSIAKLYSGEVILINIADNPGRLEVRDRERVRRSVRLHERSRWQLPDRL